MGKLKWWQGRVLRNLGMGRWGFCVLLWEPRDCWVGLYWDRKATWLDVYATLVPCFPVRIHLSGLQKVESDG